MESSIADVFGTLEASPDLAFGPNLPTCRPVRTLTLYCLPSLSPENTTARSPRALLSGFSPFFDLGALAPASLSDLQRSLTDTGALLEATSPSSEGPARAGYRRGLLKVRWRLHTDDCDRAG